MNGAAGFSPTPRRSTSPAAATGRWPTPKASAISERLSRVPANTYGTPRSAGPTSSRRTITARPTTSPGWSGRSPRPCARWKSAAAHSRSATERLVLGPPRAVALVSEQGVQRAADVCLHLIEVGAEDGVDLRGAGEPEPEC